MDKPDVSESLSSLPSMLGELSTLPHGSRDEIINYLTTFTECYSQVLSVYSGETLAKVNGQVVYIVAFVSPYLLFSDTGLKDMRDRVFKDADFRDMIFRLTSIFLSRLPNFASSYFQICSQLAWAHDIAGNGNPDVSLVPEDITARLMNFDEIVVTLLENKWLVIVLLLMKAVLVTAPPESRAGAVDATRQPLRAT